jgi:hypothetical protein
LAWGGMGVLLCGRFHCYFAGLEACKAQFLGIHIYISISVICDEPCRQGG